MNNLNLVLSIIIFISIQSCKDDQPDRDPMDVTLSEEAAYFNDYESPEMKFGYINTRGELAIEDKYDGVREFSEGLAAVNYKGKWGYVDTQDQHIIDFQYRSAFAFKDGIARVQDFNKEYWFINSSGDLLHPMGFTSAYDYVDGLARIKTEHGYNYISMAGDTLMDDVFEGAGDFKYGLGVVKQHNYSGVINNIGEIVLSTKYDRISLDQTAIRATLDGRLFLFDHQGKTIATSAYTSCSPFQNGRAVVRGDNGLKMISDQGVTLFELDTAIKRAEPANQDNWRIYTEQGVALMDPDGEIISDYYEEIYNYSDDHAGFLINKKWGFLYLDGQVSIPPAFDLIWDFNDGRARVVTQRGIGFIDQTGNLVIPPIFFEVKDFDEGLARVQIYRG